MQKTNVHPDVTALETAMSKLTAAYQDYANTARWHDQVCREIDPTSWTKRIEAAIGKPEELERLRVTYDEMALRSMSQFLRSSVAWSNIMTGRTEICDAIGKVLEAQDAIDAKSADAWLKPIMQMRCVEAAEVHRTDVQRSDLDSRSAVYQLAHRALLKAFEELNRHFVRLTGPCRAHSINPVVQARQYDQYAPRDLDLRAVWKVELSHAEKSLAPASTRLLELFEHTRTQLEVARLSEARLKGDQSRYDPNVSEINNGTVNERQHANRMIDVLHGQNGRYDADKQVANQNERRRKYESVRQEVLIAKNALTKLYGDLCEALYAAVKETEQLRAKGVHQADSLMNNCLSADLYLRMIGQELQTLDALYLKDHSHGAGQAALAASFAKVQWYRPRSGNSPGASDGPV